MTRTYFNYVLSAREFSYWQHFAPGVRSWYRGEIRARAKRLAIQAGKSTWAIFAPDESTLERFVVPFEFGEERPNPE